MENLMGIKLSDTDKYSLDKMSDIIAQTQL